ncbi:hypothetical protein FOA52_005997 [Chlamydomonas sp. UWO 241]|nr:hypothetical protein FOA52_005997 [Chlamydomonas sp. UWO 241]
MKPLIGILTQPCSTCPGTNYVAAAFVKWVEAAGGRPVPIRYHASDDELARLFKSVNALIFPGGLTWLWLDAPYVITARKLFNMAVAANDAGDVFPIHGTCLGFQLLHILASNVSRNDLLIETNSTSHAATLPTPNTTALAAKGSYMFGSMSKDLIKKMGDPSLNIALENHEYGLPPAMYQKYPVLSEWYSVLSTTKDRQGIEYVSTMQGKKYPFFGTQWHPEKPPFEFGIEEIPHTLDAVKAAQHLATTFVDAARYSSHKPESHEQELDMLIYSTPVTFSAKDEVFADDNYDGPDMTYYFDPDEKPPHGPDDGPTLAGELGSASFRVAGEVSYAASFREDQAMKASGSYAEFGASKAESRKRTTVSQILRG